MNVIFLDIDGVLNNESFEETVTFEETKILCSKLNNSIRHRTARECLANLHHFPIQLVNDLVEQTGSKIVISSAWKTRFLKSELQDILQFRGLRSTIFDYTPVLETPTNYVPRGYEIRDWLSSSSGIERFVIIDDRYDLQPCIRYLVQTEPILGLQQKDIELAKIILDRSAKDILYVEERHIS